MSKLNSDEKCYKFCNPKIITKKVEKIWNINLFNDNNRIHTHCDLNQYTKRVPSLHTADIGSIRTFQHLCCNGHHKTCTLHPPVRRSNSPTKKKCIRICTPSFITASACYFIVLVWGTKLTAHLIRTYFELFIFINSIKSNFC